MNKIDFAMMGVDKNPLYFDFWPIVSKTWKLKFGITPCLGLITDEESGMYEDEYGIVFKFKKVDFASTALQSQIVRIYMTGLVNGNCLLSDIDMLPMSRNYFVELPKQMPDDIFHVMTADSKETIVNNEFPICYNLASSSVFKEVFNIQQSWEEFVREVCSLSIAWTADQKYLFHRVQEFAQKNPNRVRYYGRGWDHMNIAIRRIDRIYWNYDIEKVKQGYYIDSHMLRPYNEFREELDRLAEALSNY